MALLHLFEGHNVSEAARLVCAARSTVGPWRGLYEEYGEAGLEPASRGRSPWTVTEEVVVTLNALLESAPETYGYVRSRWSSELLALELERQLAVKIHASTVRRLLPRLGFGYRRVRPVLVHRDPNKNRKLRAIVRALRRRRGVEVFYVDEADVDFNPRIGSAWTRRGEQIGVATPGQKSSTIWPARCMRTADGSCG